MMNQLQSCSADRVSPQATFTARHHSRKAWRNASKQRIARQNALSQTSLQSLVSPVAKALVGGLAFLGLSAGNGAALENGQQPQLSTATTEQPAAMQNAVLVFGSTGKLGRILVSELLKEGLPVVAAARSPDKAETIFEAHRGKENSFTARQADVTDEASLATEGLWQGVSQVAIAVGPVFGRQPDGEMGYSGGSTSEAVDARGVANIVAAAARHFPTQEKRQTRLVIPLASVSDLERWERVDDVIMGGRSDSAWVSADLENPTSGVWTGTLVMEGGGFCGTRLKGLNLDLGRDDGILLRVKGDGQTYKINLRTAEDGQDPESTYAATFDTFDGDWTTVRIPWRAFVPVVRARYNPAAAPLDPRRITQLGFRLSRFDFNALPNPAHRPGKFQLEVEGGIQAYRDVRPRVVLLSSAGVERNALIGDNAEARKRDIPIVQLNPGGILNWKYRGETALRGSGLPFAIVRATGLTTEEEDTHFLLEAGQGDRIVGKITRAQVARILAAALKTPDSVGKTIEARRSEAGDARGKESNAAELEALFLGAVTDWQRPLRFIPPLPSPSDPPAPPSEGRLKEILADPRVQEAAARSRAQNSNGNGASGQPKEKELQGAR